MPGIPFASRSFEPKLAAFGLSLPAVLALACCNALAAPTCSREIPVHGKCEISLEALHPTQPAIGAMQVEERAARMPPGIDGAQYTSKWAVPVVQAPDGKFYLTDGHHLASVLTRVGAEKITAEVIHRFDNRASFWDQMRARHWVYLFDSHGKPITPEELPAHIKDLGDDAYRSLAGYAEDAGFFKKTDAYFMEFAWARYFGERMGWQPIDRLTLLSALQTAQKLACQPEAQDLPGYAGPCASNK
ncbi:ParB-like protein [Noviherbaspirillum sp. UKPF54]|uniref:ParB-like protein n=1 Tax=Noviherbaspirillum sp. UKPF54 TaxID=2601898 RepID=UPI0011B165B1|nr:ParB/Srx family N-terminal domain-containing protein [Noviherbaspirillum sp. UKPF54]QDZ27794.1 chromosome partitioning protein ParB [Noviherbaspirillum sp. UKPF54]